MFPAYTYAHAYPQGRAQMSPDCHHHHPASEGLPPQMKMEASPSPFPYETWPHHYGYPVPAQCHSCCSQNTYPGHYAYRPPYPHFPSPPPHPQHYGGYPVYPEPYPFHYAPPPHYTAELPKYEYDKSAPRDFHCCGCHHHKPDMKVDKGVKIVEHESDAENKEESLIPSGFNKIAWIPPEYKKSPERPSGAKQEPTVWNGWPPLDYESIKRILEGGDERRSREDVNHQEGPSVVMPQQDLKKKSVGQEPKFPSGWMPVDVDSLQKLLQNGNLRRDHDVQPRNEGRQMPLEVDSLKKLLQNGNLRKDHDDQSRNEGHQMPFPVIWLPPFNNEEKDKTRSEMAPSTASESSKQHPLKSEQGDDHTPKSIPTIRAEGSERGRMSAEKSDKPPKTIPVKQTNEPADMKAKNILENKKSTENGTKSKPTLPTKASKFAPVCLRVDPLPKKKNGQAKTRSSSPSEKVEQVKAVKPSHTSENKVHQATENQKSEQEKKSVEVPQRKTEINVVDMDGRSRTVEIDIPLKRAGEQKEVGQKANVQEAVVKKPEESLKPEKRILSGTEAATIIQRAYRGYEVRRLEPLKKMRQISNIRDEAAAVKSCIESGASSMDLRQKTALGETIMNLLLKLDTIQGLHPIIRDFRKSVVKELVSLQEMLDTIVVKQPDSSPEATKVVGITTHALDESSQGPGISEDEAKAEVRETEVHTAEESSQNSGFSGTEDLHGVIRQPDHYHEDGRAVETTIQTPDESSQSLGISEAGVEAEAGETEVQTADESSMNSGLSRTEDQHGVEAEENAKDQIVTSKDLSVEQTSTVPDMLSDGMTPEQALPDKEPQRDTSENGATCIGEEAGSLLPDSHTQRNEFDVKEEAAVDNVAELPEAHEPIGQESSTVITEEASVELVEQELSPVVSEVHVDSADQTDMEHGLLAELPVSVLEEDRPETNILSDAEKSQEMNAESALAEAVNEGSETPLTEPEKQEPDEVSEVLIDGEKDAKIAEPVALKSPGEESGGELPISEISSSVQASQDVTTTSKEIENVDSNPLVEPDIVREVDAKPAKDEKSSALSSMDAATKEGESERRTMEENERMRKLLEKLIESEKQQQEVISSLNEKLKELEGKLAKQKPKKNKKMARTRKAKVLMPRSCKTSDGFSKEGAMDLAS